MNKELEIRLEEAGKDFAGAIFREASHAVTNYEARDQIRRTISRMPKDSVTGTAKDLIADIAEALEAEELSIPKLNAIGYDIPERNAIITEANSLYYTPEEALSILRSAYADKLTEEAPKEISKQKTVEDMAAVAEQYRREIRKLKPLSVKTAGEILEGFHDFVESRKDPIPTKRDPVDGRGPFSEFDRATGGIDRNRVYCIMAGTGFGKTAFALQLSENMARSGAKILYFALEMDTNEVISRFISSESYACSKDRKYALTATQIYRGLKDQDLLSDEEDRAKQRQMFHDACERFRKYADNITIIDRRGLTVEDIRAQVEQFKGEAGEADIVVIVDYMQILKASNPRATDKQNMDHIMTEFIDMAKKLDTPVIAISSINRGAYYTEKGLDAAKESGSIEYSADFVGSLDKDRSREADARQAEKTYKSGAKRNLRLEILKNRGGSGYEQIDFTFDAKFNFFTDGFDK